MKFIQFVLGKVNLSVIDVACKQTKDSDKNFLIPFGYVYSCRCVLSAENYVSAMLYSLSAFLFVI